MAAVDAARYAEPAPTPDTPIFDVEPAIKPSDVHVLLADDEKLSRVVIGNLLKRCGYQVTVVENGEQAVKALREAPAGTFQLVLSDVAMPGLNGPELLKFVRATPSLYALPVVMMSAHEQAGTVFECIKRGAEDYILKPVTLKEIQHLWQHVWRRRFAFQRMEGGLVRDEEDRITKETISPDTEFEEDDELLSSSDLYTVDEMRAHCQRQIERYTRVLQIIDSHPELFS